MGWSCILPGKEIDEIKTDRKKAKRFERYDISDKAVYFQGQYLPVFKIRLEYGGERPVVLAIESEEKANAAVDMICRANPDIVMEYYLDPCTGLRPEKVSPPLY